MEINTCPPPITEFKGVYQFLSNFYPVMVEYEGIIYTSVEHAYQAAKTTDTAARVKISQLLLPTHAKRAGKQLDLRPYWDSIRLEVMFELLLSKFGGELKHPLLDTGDRLLVEGNYWGDRYWGVCNSEGENHLGRLLMLVRDMYRQE